MALAAASGLGHTYPGSQRPSLRDITLELRPGEIVGLLGPSGSGKSTLLRALAGLVPHFHGGSFVGSVTVGDFDTRRARPAELAGTVASVFQDPEDQVVMAQVANEVAFGLENTGVKSAVIWPRVEEALDAVDAAHLAGRRTTELSGGELQRVCLASAVALRPRLLLLDEPTSQLDPETADGFLGLLRDLGTAVVLSEQRVGRVLSLAERVLFVEDGRLLLDEPTAEAEQWLEDNRPPYACEYSTEARPAVFHSDNTLTAASDVAPTSSPVARVEHVRYAYRGGPPVLVDADLEIRPGEIIALEGPNGCGKTTLAKIAAGLIEADAGDVERRGRAAYLSQDPGRYLMRETVLDEVALAVGGDRERALGALAEVGLEWATDRHPRDLSSGERQRLALAAVAVSEPDLLVLDEPTRGIDPERKFALAQWIEEKASGGTAVLLATHDRAFPAHRRVMLGSGREVPVAV